MHAIKIPFTVSREERAEIKRAYLDEIETANDEKIRYISEHLSKVIARLKRTEEPWHLEIAKMAIYFSELLKADSGVPHKSRKDLVAALYYLCRPFEVIPDYIPGRGYADDALVMNTCLSRLKQEGILFAVVKSDGEALYVEKSKK